MSSSSRVMAAVPDAAAVGDVRHVAFSYFDVLLLRLTDVFLWTSPQLTLGVVALCCLGGRLRSPQEPYLASWPGTVFILCCAALPLTTAQRRRRGEVVGNSAGFHTAVKHRTVFFVSALREDDQYRLDVIARAMRKLGAFTSPMFLAEASQADALTKEKEESTAAVFATFVRTHRMLICTFTAISALLAALPGAGCASLSRLADCFIVPVCLIILLATGAVLAVVEPLRDVAAYRARRQQSRSGTSAVADTRHGAQSAEDRVVEEDNGVLTVQPVHVRQALRLRRLEAHPHLRGGGAPTRYTLPPLHEKEAAALEQLLNFGAPFSTIVLKPLRLWNARLRLPATGGSPQHSRNPSARGGSLSDLGSISSQEGWRVLWERDGLRCEVKDSLAAVDGTTATPGVVTAMRMLVNVPNANVGSLQAILLDDPDGALDVTKETFGYYWDPQLVERRVLRQLSYDVSIVRTVSKSAVHGVPLTETTQVVSSAVLLDYEQQSALKLYRPFRRRRHGKKLVSSATRGLRVFLSCGVPCPAALREPEPAKPPVRPATHAVDVTSLTIGLEEVDGSLSVGLLYSLSSAAEASPYPAAWADVMQRDVVHRIERLAALLRAVGPQENEVAVYKNERGFQPLLIRQAFSERVKPEALAVAAAAAAAAATVSTEWLDKHRRSTRFADDDKGAATATSGTAKSGSDPRADSRSGGFSPTSVRFIKDLIASPVWRCVKRCDVAQVLTAAAADPPPVAGESGSSQKRGEHLRAARAAKVRVFLPRATLPIVDDVLRRAELAPVYDPFVEQRVGLTVLQAAELLSRAVPDLVDDMPDSPDGPLSQTEGGASGASNDHGSDSPARTATTLAAVSAGLAEERRRERVVQWVRCRPPALGGLGALFLAPRDYVLGVTTGEYFCAGDLFSSKRAVEFFGEDGVRQLPAFYRELAPETRMFLRCGEDVSGLLPPLEGVKRGHVRLSGVLCWETTAGAALNEMASAGDDASQRVPVDPLAEDIDPHEKGVMLVRCFVTVPGGWMSSWLWRRSLEEELDNMIQLRKLVADAVADTSVA